MKLKLQILSAFLLIAFCTQAQMIEEKSISYKGSYGEKKLKKAPKRIYIASFAAYFNVAAEMTATSAGGRQIGGGSYKGSTSTYMGVAIDNIDSDDFIEIVDDVYKNFVQDLKDQGYEIITPDEAARAPFYEDWTRKPGGRISSSQIKGYVMAVPTGYEYFVKKESNKGKEKTTFVDKTMILSKDLDDAIIAEAAFIFPTIDMEGKGGVYASGSKVKAYINYRMAPVGGDGTAMNGTVYSRIKFVQGKGPGLSALSYLTCGLKKGVPIQGVFADTKFKESTRASTTTAYPGYYSVVFTDDKATTITHTAAADHDAYVDKSKAVMNELSKLGTDYLKETVEN